MVEETIKAIKETEVQAEQIVKDAEQQCAQILEKAREDALALKVEREKEANRKADKLKEDAKAEGDQFAAGMFEKLKVKEGCGSGNYADAKSKYLRAEKRPEGDSGKDSVHGDYGDHPCTGG